MNKPNFQAMNKKELRAYVLTHREDNEAFYALVDKLHENVAAIEAAVCEWLHFQYPDRTIHKNSEKPSHLILTDPEGNITEVKIHTLGSSLPTNKPFIEILINDMADSDREKLRNIITVFAIKDETNARRLEAELAEIDFDTLTQSSRIVGYIQPGGKFQNI